MIKETCSCGAQIEISFTYSSQEQTTIDAWRRDHKHESQTVAPLLPKMESGLITIKPDPNQYVLNEDYVYNGDGDPVWISNTNNPPPFWYLSVPKKPLDVRNAMYDSPA
jgi:hypothetical protein